MDLFARGKTFVPCGITRSIGARFLNFSPVIKAEGKDWKFMGIFSKNREEWAIIDIACIRDSITIVPFFDSLGPDALSFVLNQTEVTTMCIEGP